jgi:DNA helicase MCM8
MAEVDRFEFRGEASNDVLLKQSFGAFLYHFPIQALPVINVSMVLAVATLWRSQIDKNMPTNAAKVERFLDTCQLTVRLIHATPQLPMADIKTGLVRKFISVKGHVVKARPKRLRVATADFACQKCATIITHAFDQGRFSLPTKCTLGSCRSRSFTLIRPTARYVNVQELRLQESQEESTSHAGRTPRQLQVELRHDLIDSCRPGDIVLLACYVDAVNSAVAAGKTGRRAMETSTYTLFLQGHSITTLSESISNRGDGKKNKIVYTQQQLQNISQLCHADHRCLSLVERRAFPFDLLVRSLCPSIIGHHTVKAGILLCLLGGTPAVANGQNDRGTSIRSNSHILVVGDPGTFAQLSIFEKDVRLYLIKADSYATSGMGKSQMLNAATQLAARSVFVGGNTASTTGLTVTLTKEEGGETGIEAGALVLADQGVACIDELDKCKHLDGLLEAMEQQQVSIAKAGVVASLPARCSVIAAANPKHGSYNMSKTVAENLNMARPILSRFDLVFILRDRADKEQDRLVSSNIMNLYRNENSSSAASQSLSLFLPKSPVGANNSGSKDGRVPLEKRLAWVSSFNDPLPAALVRDYIAYAREFCRPKLTPQAAAILKEYYMNLRCVYCCLIYASCSWLFNNILLHGSAASFL